MNNQTVLSLLSQVAASGQPALSAQPDATGPEEGNFSDTLAALITALANQVDSTASAEGEQQDAWLVALLGLFGQAPVGPPPTPDPAGETSEDLRPDDAVPGQTKTATSLTEVMAALQPIVSQSTVQSDGLPNAEASPPVEVDVTSDITSVSITSNVPPDASPRPQPTSAEPVAPTDATSPAPAAAEATTIAEGSSPPAHPAPAVPLAEETLSRGSQVPAPTPSTEAIAELQRPAAPAAPAHSIWC